MKKTYSVKKVGNGYVIVKRWLVGARINGVFKIMFTEEEVLAVLNSLV